MTIAWVYILQCNDGTFYVGLTKQSEPEARVWEHNSGVYADSYTSRRLPVVLVYAEPFESITEAIATERRIKGWSRAKKLALMKGDWRQLIALSKRRGGKP